MIELVPLSTKHHARLGYELDAVQRQFSALPNVWFGNQDDIAHKIAICNDGVAVGFFVLDAGQDKADYSNNPKAVLLRSMSINPTHQSKGYAKQALSDQCLGAFCKQYLPDCDMVVLGVNHANIPAQKLYENVGFFRCQRTVMGKQGLQFVYELKI